MIVYKVSLDHEEISLIHRLLVDKHYEVYKEQGFGTPELGELECAIWALESAEGVYVSTFEETLENREKEDDVE
jgi:hypothetical protein